LLRCARKISLRNFNFRRLQSTPQRRFSTDDLAIQHDAIPPRPRHRVSPALRIFLAIFLHAILFQWIGVVAIASQHRHMPSPDAPSPRAPSPMDRRNYRPIAVGD
jgi:hypothetical protein